MWTSPPLVVFEAMAATIEARFGAPVGRDIDSNGHGLFDAHLVTFPCGLEVALWRFHAGAQLRTIDPATEPSLYEIHANQRDLAHIAFHVEVPIEAMRPWIDRDGNPLAAPAPRDVIVMRTDDNGNDVEVKRLTNRCEAEALAHAYAARGHKQTYWITTPPAAR